MFTEAWNRDGMAIDQNFNTTPSILHITTKFFCYKLDKHLHNHFVITPVKIISWTSLWGMEKIDYRFTATQAIVVVNSPQKGKEAFQNLIHACYSGDKTGQKHKHASGIRSSFRIFARSGSFRTW